MKINDKSLIAYACSHNGIDKNGYLNKKGEVHKKQKKRWFVLKGNLLFYSEHPDNSPLGMIVLENCSVEISDMDAYSFCIRYKTNNSVSATRTYVLSAASEVEMEHWMKSLTSASYAFISMVVSEFENTILECKGIENSNELVDVSDTTDSKLTVFPLKLSHSNEDVSSVRNRTVSDKPISKKSQKADSKSRASDMFTITTMRQMTKQKFKTLDTIRRSKSSENINKIVNTGRSPNPRRKSKNQTTKRGVSYVVVKDKPAIAYENDKSTFERLHTNFGADIWCRIGETL